MEQLGFDFAPKPKVTPGKARRTDPTPSRDAAAVVDTKRQRQLILAVLKAAGRRMTVKEIAERMNTAANAISPRFAPMEREGILERGSKEERQAYKSNVRCDVWGIKENQ